MTVERLNQYINNRLNQLQEEFDIALECYNGKSIPISMKINRAAADAEHDIYSVIWSIPDGELSIHEINSLVLHYQEVVSKMRLKSIYILIDKNGGI